MAPAMLKLVWVFSLVAGVQSTADVRLVDAAGGLSNVGLLQVNTDAGFGTVCGANAAAADATRRVSRGLGIGAGLAEKTRAPSLGIRIYFVTLDVFVRVALTSEYRKA